MRYLRSVLLAGVCTAIVITPGVEARQTPPAQSKPPAKPPSTLKEAREALSGKWLLVTLTIHNPDGRSALIEASGTLVMDQTGGGDAINGSLTVNSGGTVEFQGDNQVPSWQTVTLNTGSTLLLGDTTQAFTNLVIAGDSVIDFGSGGSSLNLSSVTVTNNAILTIVNWNNAVDMFSAQTNPGSSVVQVYYADTGTTGTYTSGSGSIKPGTPVPEPAVYGALMTGSSIAFLFWLRRRPRQA